MSYTCGLCLLNCSMKESEMLNGLVVNFISEQLSLQENKKIMQIKEKRKKKRTKKKRKTLTF